MGNPKRWLAALLCGVLAVTALFTGVGAASGYKVGTLKRVSLSFSADYVNDVATTDAEALSAAKTFLSGAGGTAKKPSAPSRVAALTVEDTAGKKTEFHLVRSGGDYLLQQGTRYRRTSYSDFNRLVNAIGSEKIYKYRSYPTGLLRTEDDELVLDEKASLAGGTYSYRRLSGSFQEVKVPASTEDWIAQTTADALPLPSFDRTPGSTRVTVKSSDGMTWQGSGADAKAYKLPKAGDYTVRVNITDDNEWYKYDIAYAYMVEYSGALKFSVSGSDTHLGEVVVLRVDGTKSDDPIATFTSDIAFNLPPAFHRREDGSQVALFPVSYLNKAGEHWVEIQHGGRSARYTIRAKDKTWQRQDLDVSAATSAETIESQQANAEYERVIGPLRSAADSAQYWSGRFILPVSDQKVTTQFGMVRYVNGAPTSVRHGALDLAVPRGTGVKATGGGRVLYAGFLQLTGNTVLIEHGYGLKSWYYHMDSLSVKTDDRVRQGQVIGTVGSTGFSTGPHLHFGMTVNNVSINPYTAIHTDLLDF